MLVRSVIYRKNGWGFNFIRPFHLKTPLKSEPLSSGNNGVFYLYCVFMRLFEVAFSFYKLD